MLRVALTGGIGSGKTTVAERFAALGVPVIDADELARELVHPGAPAFREVVRLFGESILDASGHIDRATLGDLVFSDPEKRKRLEAILHPRVFAAMQGRVERLDAPVVVLVVPLLLETGRTELADRILVVDTSENVQIQRVIERNNLSEAQVRKILEAQISREQRLALADDVIDNSRGLAYLLAQTDQFHRMYLELAGANRPK